MYAILEKDTKRIIGLSDGIGVDTSNLVEISDKDVKRITSTFNTKFFYIEGVIKEELYEPELPSGIVKEVASKRSIEEETLSAIAALKTQQEIINQAVMALIGGM